MFSTGNGRICPECGTASLSRWALFIAGRRRGARCRTCGARVANAGSLLRAIGESLLADTAFIVAAIIGLNLGCGIMPSALIGLIVFASVGICMEWNAKLKVISSGKAHSS